MLLDSPRLALRCLEWKVETARRTQHRRTVGKSGKHRATDQSETALSILERSKAGTGTQLSLGRTLQLSRKANVCKFRIHFATNTKTHLDEESRKRRGKGRGSEGWCLHIYTRIHHQPHHHLYIVFVCVARWFRCCCYLCCFLVHKTADICCFQFRTLRPQTTSD